MTDGKSDVKKRDFIKGMGVVGLSTFGLTGIASAEHGGDLPGNGPGKGGRGRGRYPIVEDRGLYEDTPLDVYAIEAAKQPHHDRVAFSTTAFGDGYELYLAEGVDSLDDIPETVRRVTDSALFVYEFGWEKGNRLQYTRDFTEFVRKVPLSEKVFDPVVVNEDTLRGGQ